jgi:hypothetical protein
MKRQAKNKRTRRKSPANLAGMRFGRWTVLKSAETKMYVSPAGEKFLRRLWLCRCDCGVEKNVPGANLTRGLSTQCQKCHRTRQGMSSTKVYKTWSRLKTAGILPKEWRDFDAFRKAVGDPPDETAYLARFDRTRPYSSENAFWRYPALLQDDPAFLHQIRRQLMEERIAHDKRLMRIRTAKNFKERNRFMIVARKAGYTLSLIGMAANVTTQRAQFIVARSCR